MESPDPHQTPGERNLTPPAAPETQTTTTSNAPSESALNATALHKCKDVATATELECEMCLTQICYPSESRDDEDEASDGEPALS